MKLVRKMVEVEDEQWQYLKDRAKKNGRTVSGEMRSILEGLKKRDKSK